MDWIFAILAAILGFAAGGLLCRTRSLRRLHAMQAEHLRVLDTALAEARTDSLTEIWNRKAFDENLQIQLAIARRYRTPLTLILIDVDGLKQINDRQGHIAGDAALRALALLLRQCAREADFVARYGGDEFAILMSQTACPNAAILANRVLTALEATATRPANTASILRISAGAAAFHSEDSPAMLIERADRALYEAKKAGGACVRLAVSNTDTEPSSH